MHYSFGVEVLQAEQEAAHYLLYFVGAEDVLALGYLTIVPEFWCRAVRHQATP